MNLLLLTDDDLDDPPRPPEAAGEAVARIARIDDERVRHVRRVLGKEEGDELVVGLLRGRRGRGRILQLSTDRLEMSVVLDQTPPAILDLDLVLALPRPKFLGRILQSATTFGVRRLTLMHSHRVEKSYWSSSLMAPAALQRHLHLGLEQAGSTTPPELELRHHFGDFVSRELAVRVQERPAILAESSAPEPFPRRVPLPATLVVGPEGGFLNDEIEALEAVGVRTASLGERILKVEVAVAACLSRCLPDPLPHD